jgi:hypothetical protein
MADLAFTAGDAGEAEDELVRTSSDECGQDVRSVLNRARGLTTKDAKDRKGRDHGCLNTAFVRVL